MPLHADLRSSIAYALKRERKLMRAIERAHVSDDLADQLAGKIVTHLELSFELDEEKRCLRKRAPAQGHGGGRV